MSTDAKVDPDCLPKDAASVCVSPDSLLACASPAAHRSPEAFPSCPFIERAVVFQPRHYALCCKGAPPWQDLGHFDSDSELSLDRLHRVREGLRTVNRSGGHPICVKCGYLTTAPWDPKPQYPISLMNFGHFYRCNSRCCYCYIQDPGRQLPDAGWHPSSPRKTLVRLIEQDAISPDTNVLWGGGEPTILADFEEIFGLLAAHGCWHTVNSNCINLSRTLEDSLRQSDRVKLITSLDSGTAETFRRVKGVDAFERVVDNVGAYCRAARNRDNIALKYVLLDENLDDRDLNGFADVASNHGVSRCCCDFDGNLKAPIPDVQLDAMAKLIRELQCRGVRVAVHGPGMINHPRERLEDRIRKRLDNLCQPPELAARCLFGAVWPDAA